MKRSTGSNIVGSALIALSLTACGASGADDVTVDDLVDRYHTVCDPRLNGRQGLDLAFAVAELIRTSGFA